MSDLLQRAIIDAKTLKEAAAKNAEQLIIEKFSQRIKEAVETMLEKDDEMEDGLDGLGGGDEMPTGLGDLGGEGGMEDMSGMGGDTETSPMDADLGSDMLGSTPTEETVVDAQAPLAANSDDEEIEIDFSELEKRLNSGNEKEPDVGEMAAGEDIAAEMPPETDTPYEKPMNVNQTTGELEGDEDEGLGDIDENILGEILETLEVDYDGELDGRSGWLGANRAKKQEVADGSLAKKAAEEKKDEDVMEIESDLTADLIKAQQENEKTHEKLEEVKQNLVNMSKKNGNLEKEVTKLGDSLKNILIKLNESNIINAKLLYMNKILKSDKLNSKQKKIYTEQLMKTNSVEKAKVVYETLLSSVGSVANNTAKVTETKSLHEALSRQPSMTYLRSSRKEDEGVSESFTARMKVLAGIKEK